MKISSSVDFFTLKKKMSTHKAFIFQTVARQTFLLMYELLKNTIHPLTSPLSLSFPIPFFRSLNFPNFFPVPPTPHPPPFSLPSLTTLCPPILPTLSNTRLYYVHSQVNRIHFDNKRPMDHIAHLCLFQNSLT